jgi:hypothetical protein
MQTTSISLPLVRRVSEGQIGRAQEADMTRQRTFSRTPEIFAGAALIGLGLLVLANLGEAATATRLNCPLGATAGTALQVFASVVLASGSQVLQALIFDPQRFFQGFFQTLASFWLLIFVIVGAALLRAAFADRV